MKDSTGVLVVLGLGLMGAGAYFVLRPTKVVLPPVTTQTNVVPTSVPITNGSVAKTLECAGGAIAGGAASQSLGVPPTVGASLGCALAPAAVKTAEVVAKYTADAAKATASTLSHTAVSVYNDSIGKIVSWL